MITLFRVPEVWANSLTIPKNDMKHCHVIITGSVQGVGFRQFVCTKARTHHVTGRIWNNSDGSVEAILEGNSEHIQSLLNCCKQGPSLSSVEKVHVCTEHLIEKSCFDSFEIESSKKNLK